MCVPVCIHIYIYIYCILALKYICNYKFSTLSVVMSNGLNPCKGPSKDICCMSTRQDQIKECFKVFCCFGFDIIIFVSNLLSSSLLYRHYITLCFLNSDNHLTTGQFKFVSYKQRLHVSERRLLYVPQKSAEMLQNNV